MPESNREYEYAEGHGLVIKLDSHIANYSDLSEEDNPKVLENERGVQVNLEFYPNRGEDSYYGKVSAIGLFETMASIDDFNEWLLDEGAKQVYYAIREHVKMLTISGPMGTMSLPSVI
jgi:hypothetical protein